MLKNRQEDLERPERERDCKALGPRHNRMNGPQNCCWLNQCLLIPSLQAREQPWEGREATCWCRVGVGVRDTEPSAS